MATTQVVYTRAQLTFLIDAFLEGMTFARKPGCCLWLGDKAGNVDATNSGNLWFQGVERKNPALLAVRTELDGAINYRESQTEGQIHAANTGMWVNRGELKQYLVAGARKRGLMTTAVYQLTEAKAHGETLARALDLSSWDSL